MCLTLNVLILLLILPNTYAQTATFTPLGAPPDANSSASGVSPDGTVIVGRVGGADPGAVRWVHGVLEHLAHPEGGFVQNALAASTDGSVVVGRAYPPGGPPDNEGFRWEAGTSILLGDLPGGSRNSTALDVSADGSVVVGYSSISEGSLAFRWEGGVMEALPDLPGGGTISRAYAVSADGHIVAGWGDGPNGTEAIRWVDGVIESLGFPDGTDVTQATDMSADGTVVVGYAHQVGPPSGTVGFVWREGAGMALLPDIPGGSPYREALAVSGDGRVIIGAADGASGLGAAIWTPEGAFMLRDYLTAQGVDLTGWFLGIAGYHSVSYDGTVIAGSGTNPEGNQQAWRVELPPFPVAAEPEAPETGTLTLAAGPNPFRGHTTFRLALPEAGAATLAVYDVLGREVARLVDGRIEAGTHTAVFDASMLPSGTYLVRFTAGGQAQTQRLTLLK